MTEPVSDGNIIKTLFYACLISLVLLSSCKNYDYKSPLEIHELVSRTESQGTIIVIDIRSQVKYRDGHIQGAINIPSESKNFEERIQGLDRGNDLVLYCGTGLKTDKAAGTACSAGFKKVYVLQGGLEAWEKSGYALVK